MSAVTSLIHIHIPRAAGSSLHAHLYGPLHKAGIELVSEHCFWGEYDPREGRLFFIVLREPVARVLSLAAYILEQPDHEKYAQLAAVGLDEYLRDKAVRNSQMANGQVHILAGRETVARPVGLAEYMAAARVLERPDVVVALADDLDAGLRTLSERIGVELPPEAPRRNTTKPAQWNEETRDLVAFTNRAEGRITTDPMEARSARVVLDGGLEAVQAIDLRELAGRGEALELSTRAYHQRSKENEPSADLRIHAARPQPRRDLREVPHGLQASRRQRRDSRPQQ